MTEKDVGQSVIQLIRKIVQEELDKVLKDKFESVAKAQIKTINDNDTYDVLIIETNKTVKGLVNKSGEENLDTGNFVKIYYTQGNYSNGYIGYKF